MFIAALLKSIPVGCTDVSSPHHFVKRADVNCLTYKVNKERYDILWLLRAVCMHRTGTQKLEEETSNLSNALCNVNFNSTFEKLQEEKCSRSSHHWTPSKSYHFGVRYWSIRNKELLKNLPNDLCGDSTQPQLHYVITIFAILLMWTRSSKRFVVPPVIFFRSGNLQRHLPKCEELVRNINPETGYQLRELLFDKLRAFDNEIAEDKTPNNSSVFDIESICVKDSSPIDTETTTWVDKHEPISVFVTSNLLQEPISICDMDLSH